MFDVVTPSSYPPFNIDNVCKICGSTGEACCGIVNIADFKSLQEGQIYDYTGDEGLEDCYRFPLDKVLTNQDTAFVLTNQIAGGDGGGLQHDRLPRGK